MKYIIKYKIKIEQSNMKLNATIERTATIQRNSKMLIPLSYETEYIFTPHIIYFILHLINGS